MALRVLPEIVHHWHQALSHFFLVPFPSSKLLSLTDAWKQMVIEAILVELARRVYIEIKGAVIVRAWRKSRRRLANKNRKVCS